MLTNFLKKKLKRYLVVGILTNALFLSYLMLVNYKNNLEESLSAFSRLTINHVKIKNSIEEMDHVMKTINTIYPYDNSIQSNDALFLAADNIRNALKGGDITLQEIIRDRDEMALPVDIVMANITYSDLVHVIGYLRSLVFPYVTIENLGIEKEGVQETGFHIKSNLKVLLKMPDNMGAGNNAMDS